MQLDQHPVWYRRRPTDSPSDSTRTDGYNDLVASQRGQSRRVIVMRLLLWYADPMGERRRVRLIAIRYASALAVPR